MSGYKRKTVSSSFQGHHTTKRPRPSPDDPMSLLYEDDSKSSSTNQARVDPIYGQRSAFPGLDEVDNDDGLFYGPASDGLEYLRMVRHEAKSVPNLLIVAKAPAVVETEEGEIDEEADHGKGWYADGAYTAAPIEEDSHQDYEGSEKDTEIDPQEAYYAALLRRFEAFRHTLSNPPKTLPTPAFDHPALKMKQSDWRYGLRFKAPTPSLLVTLSQENVIRALGRLETLLTKSNLLGKQDERNNMGTWAWGLLAKCRSIGEMGSDDVAVLRCLGKTALKVAAKIRYTESSEELEEGASIVDDREDNDGQAILENGALDTADLASHSGTQEEAVQVLVVPGVESAELSLDDAKSLLLQKLQGSSSTILHAEEPPSTPMLDTDGDIPMDGPAVKASTTPSIVPLVEEDDHEDGEISETEDTSDPVHCALATLDIIVTIVGSFYGQRDLLYQREAWN